MGAYSRGVQSSMGAKSRIYGTAEINEFSKNSHLATVMCSIVLYTNVKNEKIVRAI